MLVDSGRTLSLPSISDGATDLGGNCWFGRRPFDLVSNVEGRREMCGYILVPGSGRRGEHLVCVHDQAG